VHILILKCKSTHKEKGASGVTINKVQAFAEMFLAVKTWKYSAYLFHRHPQTPKVQEKEKYRSSLWFQRQKKRYSTYVVLQNAVYLGILLVKFTQCSLSKQLLLSSFFLSQSFLIQHLDR